MLAGAAGRARWESTGRPWLERIATPSSCSIRSRSMGAAAPSHKAPYNNICEICCLQWGRDCTSIHFLCSSTLVSNERIVGEPKQLLGLWNLAWEIQVDERLKE